MSKAVDSVLLHIRHSTCEADNVSPWSPPSQGACVPQGFPRSFSHLYLELLPVCPLSSHDISIALFLSLMFLNKLCGHRVFFLPMEDNHISISQDKIPLYFLKKIYIFFKRLGTKDANIVCQLPLKRLKY